MAYYVNEGYASLANIFGYLNDSSMFGYFLEYISVDG